MGLFHSKIHPNLQETIQVTQPRPLPTHLSDIQIYDREATVYVYGTEGHIYGHVIEMDRKTDHAFNQLYKEIMKLSNKQSNQKIYNRESTVYVYGNNRHIYDHVIKMDQKNEYAFNQLYNEIKKLQQNQSDQSDHISTT